VTADTWRPFKLADPVADQAEANGGAVAPRVVNLRLTGKDGNGGADRAARWLRCAMIALGLLAGAAAAVSFAAQYHMVYAAKGVPAVAAMEAGIPDAAALIFAALGIALALHGKRAIRPRVLNVGAVATSIVMNLLAAGHGWRDLAIWVMPPVAYALASDTAIGVIRAYTLARQRGQDEHRADDETTPLAVLGGVTLWLLRLTLAAPSTLRGFRNWVVAECPAAPQSRALTVAQTTAADAQTEADIAREERDRAETAFADASAALEQLREERDQAVEEAAGLLGALRHTGHERPALAPAAKVRTRTRGDTKTARFLALVAERHGQLAGIPLDRTARIAAELAPEVDLDPGSARRELRLAVQTAQQDGGQR
jgi:hypothetical protein